MSRTRRRFLTFGLRFVFVAITVTAIAFATWSHKERRLRSAKQAISGIQSLGGMVWLISENEPSVPELSAFLKEDFPDPAFDGTQMLAIGFGSEIDFTAAGRNISWHSAGCNPDAFDFAKLNDLWNVYFLDTTSRHLSDCDLEHISSQHQLEVLKCGDCTSVTSAGYRHLEKLPNLVRLELHYTQLSDSDLFYLRGATSLEELALPRAAIKGNGLIHLWGMTSLRSLDLRYTHITDSDLSHLSRCVALEELFLVGTNITDAGLVELQKLSRLRWLSLGKTSVTSAGYDRLKQKRPNLFIVR